MVLDKFFVPFYSTENTQTGVSNNYTQRVIIITNKRFFKIIKLIEKF